jgi:hypothetical protein
VPYVLLGTTQDNYTTGKTPDPNTLTFPECWLVDLVITGASIAYQLQYADPALGQTGSSGIWLPEAVQFLGTGNILFVSKPRRTTGIRIRSWIAGSPAGFYLEAVPPNEMPPLSLNDPMYTGRSGVPYVDDLFSQRS